MPIFVQNGPAVTPCPPGQHPISWGRFGGYLCGPDVPGAGLPWDLPTAVSGIAALIFALVLIGYLVALEIGDRRASR